MSAIDARGLSCPQPLSMVMSALKKEKGPITVLINSESAFESISRTLKSQKRTVAISRNGDEITLEIGPLS
ncbi:MAG: sulfurtransferase TusA family protein [Deltaproteobacteria bacterium]|jgi:TusA-related sulfurtransferase|nr:sulfurtransferase TusA family protein [Deltaproteobacteria bacterium]